MWSFQSFEKGFGCCNIALTMSKDTKLNIFLEIVIFWTHPTVLYCQLRFKIPWPFRGSGYARIVYSYITESFFVLPNVKRNFGVNNVHCTCTVRLILQFKWSFQRREDKQIKKFWKGIRSQRDNISMSKERK